MIPDKSRALYKYFALADRFLRVRLLSEAPTHCSAQPGLNRSGYRRSVIRACIEELERDLEARLQEWSPGDPRQAEDLLYQLCVAVNPKLDIHSVSLRDEQPGLRPRAPEAPGGERRSQAAQPELEPLSEERFFGRLRRRVEGLEQRLGKRVLGQTEAIEAVARGLRRAAAGLAPEGRPLANLLFLGRTGTGKTELAKALAHELYGGEEGALIRIDCSEYALAHEASKLTGAPPGYIGHEEGGCLTEALRRRPECVLLFDEVEKAHPRMHHLLLQLLDDGRLGDHKGKSVRCERALVILTSNAGAREMGTAADPMGFQRGSALDQGTLGEIAQRALAQQFSPEFLGRLDETLVFRELNLCDARRIAELQLEELAVRLRRRGRKVAFSRSLAHWLAQRGFEPASGVRSLVSVRRREIEAPLAQFLLSRSERGGLVRVGLRGDRPSFAT